MDHNDREWSVGALVLLLRALEKQARDLGTFMDEEGSARSPKMSEKERALREQEDAAAKVWSEGMRVICRHPDLAGDVADALKKIVDKVKTEAPQE